MIFHRHMAALLYAPYERLIWKYPVSSNKIYLTFDDGPYPPTTVPLLELLRSLQVQATFFITGDNLFHFRRDVKHLNYQGHVLGNHFYHHIPAISLNARKIKKELTLTDRLILNYLHRQTDLFRPPFGIFGPGLLNHLTVLSKKIVMWSLMSYDYKWEPDKVLDYLYRSVRSGDIIVFHDNPQSEKIVVKVLEPFIKRYRKLGWGFGLVQ